MTPPLCASGVLHPQFEVDESLGGIVKPVVEIAVGVVEVDGLAGHVLGVGRRAGSGSVDGGGPPAGIHTSLLAEGGKESIRTVDGDLRIRLQLRREKRRELQIPAHVVVLKCDHFIPLLIREHLVGEACRASSTIRSGKSSQASSTSREVDSEQGGVVERRRDDE